MATALTSSIRIGATLIPSSHQNQVASRFVGLKVVSFTPQRRAFPSLQSPSSSSSACRVFCVAQAKPQTVRKVCEVVKKILALSDDVTVTPESNFSEIGAHPLDMLEILMVLEEEFEIIVQEEKGRSDNIITVRGVADKIEKYLEESKSSLRA